MIRKSQYFFLCVESESTKTPTGKATAENPLHKFWKKLMKLVEVLPVECVVDSDGTHAL